MSYNRIKTLVQEYSGLVNRDLDIKILNAEGEVVATGADAGTKLPTRDWATASPEELDKAGHVIIGIPSILAFIFKLYPKLEALYHAGGNRLKLMLMADGRKATSNITTTLFALKIIKAEGLEAGKDYPRYTDLNALFPFAILNCPESYEAISKLGASFFPELGEVAKNTEMFLGGDLKMIALLTGHAGFNCDESCIFCSANTEERRNIRR